MSEELHNDDSDGSESGKLTASGELLSNMQDINHRYARVHLRRILSTRMWQRVVKREQHYVQNPRELDGKVNKRMPWTEYKKLILSILPRNAGELQLAALQTMPREDGQTADDWVQRLHADLEGILSGPPEFDMAT